MNTLHKILKFLFYWLIAFGVAMLIHSIIYFNLNDTHKSVCDIFLSLFVIYINIINLIAIKTK